LAVASYARSEPLNTNSSEEFNGHRRGDLDALFVWGEAHVEGVPSGARVEPETTGQQHPMGEQVRELIAGDGLQLLREGGSQGEPNPQRRLLPRPKVPRRICDCGSLAFLNPDCHPRIQGEGVGHSSVKGQSEWRNESFHG